MANLEVFVVSNNNLGLKRKTNMHSWPLSGQIILHVETKVQQRTSKSKKSLSNLE